MQTSVRVGLCECGCGETTSLMTVNHAKRGLVKGQPMRYVHGHNSRTMKHPSGLVHGHNRRGWRSPTYQSWRSMMSRCYDMSNNRYIYYGARGITICEPWRESFENFLADMGERPAGRTLDRINNAGNYQPDNCRWATPAEQAQNRRRRST